MNNNKIITPIIMAGGSGSRLWPLSRILYPKQFLSLNGSHTMLQTTANRLDGLDCTNPYVICNEQYRFIVAEQLRKIDRLTSKNIILEPVGRNTAPAIALAALLMSKSDKSADDLMLVLAADHVILDEEKFCNAVRSAIPYAADGKLVTFGIIPDKAETGYGYIHRGQYINQEDSDAFIVSSFVEKPNHETATKYLASGEYYWNSGMFLFSANRYIEELKQFRPDILSACEKAIASANFDLDFVRLDESSFSKCPEESIDYAVMEKTKDAIVIPMDAGWSDVGSWSSLWEINDKDSDGNVIVGDIFSHETKNSFIYAESGIVATVGVENLVVVQTKDAVLVSERNKVQDVKKIVEQIKNSGRSEHYVHREVYRPWGKYDSIDTGERYQVKRITVNPGEGLSLQMHHHRAEHWIIVSGTAKVTIGSETKILSENESVYIPLGVIHCLENPGKIPLDLIEVRSGSYLEEDDVIRFQDRYGRS